jgi:hypothetical protein
MKRRFADYDLAAAALIGGAVLFVSVGILTNRGDLTSATLVLAGVASFVAGLYLFTFSRGDPFDPRIAALLPVQGSIEVSTLCADLGAGGNGHVLATDTGALVHFIPVAEFRPPGPPDGRTFLLEGEGGHGIALAPAGKPLLALLEKEYGLTIPREEAGLFTLLEEVGQQVLSLAETVTAVRSGENVVVELRNYRLIEGCRAMQETSPRCCSIYPCPVCSLFACLLARGTGKAFTLEQTLQEGSSLRLIYSGIP